MITEEDVNTAFENEFDGQEKFLLVQEILELREKHRWIPVSERLPEKTDEYLVLPYRQHCPVLWYQRGEWFWYDHTADAISDTIGNNTDEPIFEVTHWKPIQCLKNKP